MNNTYYLLRHGTAQSNVGAFMQTAPAVGIVENGILLQGVAEVEKNAHNSNLAVDTLFFTSDFLRTRETAELFAKIIGAAPPVIDKRLRERWMGDWNGKPLSTIAGVSVAEKTAGGVETWESLQKRMEAVVADCEQNYSGKTIVLVSHGDPIYSLICKNKGDDPLSNTVPYPHRASLTLLES